MSITNIFWLAILISCYLVNDVIAKSPDPYKVLGIPRSATEEQIKDGFKKRSKKYHPDRNKVDPRAKEKFQKIVNAYELLKDPERKRIYDMTGDDNPQAQQGHGFHGGGFGFGGGGINIQDLIRQGFRGFGGHPGGHFGGQHQGRRTYSFSFGGQGQNMHFQF